MLGDEQRYLTSLMMLSVGNVDGLPHSEGVADLSHDERREFIDRAFIVAIVALIEQGSTP